MDATVALFYTIQSAIAAAFCCHDGLCNTLAAGCLRIQVRDDGSILLDGHVFNSQLSDFFFLPFTENGNLLYCTVEIFFLNEMF